MIVHLSWLREFLCHHGMSYMGTVTGCALSEHKLTCTHGGNTFCELRPWAMANGTVQWFSRERRKRRRRKVQQ